jgi:hypothetical protein
LAENWGFKTDAETGRITNYEAVYKAKIDEYNRQMAAATGNDEL